MGGRKSQFPKTRLHGTWQLFFRAELKRMLRCLKRCEPRVRNNCAHKCSHPQIKVAQQAKARSVTPNRAIGFARSSSRLGTVLANVFKHRSCSAGDKADVFCIHWLRERDRRFGHDPCYPRPVKQRSPSARRTCRPAALLRMDPEGRLL
jgi:hypothetical protein